MGFNVFFRINGSTPLTTKFRIKKECVDIEYLEKEGIDLTSFQSLVGIYESNHPKEKNKNLVTLGFINLVTNLMPSENQIPLSPDYYDNRLRHPRQT